MTLDMLLSSPWVETLGWALLHFLWQGSIIALALYLLLMLTPSRKANLRYGLACLALGLMLSAPVITFTGLHASTLPTVGYAVPAADPPAAPLSAEAIQGEGRSGFMSNGEAPGAC